MKSFGSISRYTLDSFQYIKGWILKLTGRLLKETIFIQTYDLKTYSGTLSSLFFFFTFFFFSPVNF